MLQPLCQRSVAFRAGMIAGFLVSAALAASAQMPVPPAATANEVSELRSSLAETRNELQLCRREISLLRQELQQVQTAMGIPNRVPDAASGRQFPTIGAAQQAPAMPETGQSEDQQLLTSKVDEMEQTKVESASRYKVRLSGLVLMNAFSNWGNVDIQDLANLAFATPKGVARGNTGATLRQTMVGLEVAGPSVAGARTSARVDMDFFGGFPDAHYGVTAGLVRLRTAVARMEWEHTTLVAGQDGLFFSPLSPTSYANVAQPSFSWSGNLWVWTPQIRVERRWTTSETSQFAWQGGVLDALTEEIPEQQFNRQPNPGELSRAPALATRVSWTGSALGRKIAFGAGAYFARQNYNFGRNVDAWAGTADWTVPLARRWELSGEFYRGRAVGGLGGGIWNSIVANGNPALASSAILGLNSVGGWSQLKFEASPRLQFNVAAGSDNPLASDLRIFPHPQTEYFPPLARNQTAFLNSIFRVRSNLLLALEYRHLRTYAAQGTKKSADQVNLAIGVSF